jgi:NAD+ synthase (glutamine-hydrolysing)
MNNNIRITIAQQNFWVGNIPYNVEKIIQATRHAQQVEKADWVIFSELALTGYPPEDLLLREDFLEAAQAALKTVCEALPQSKLIVGFPQRLNGCVYNAAAVIENGEIKSIAQKQKLPNYGVFDEERYFKPGSHSCVVNLSGINTAILICEDIWKKEPLAEAVKQGAQMAIVINASPFSLQKPEEREAVLRSRVQTHSVPILYAHGIGGQDELMFDGGSLVVCAKGEIVQQAPFFEEAFLTVEIAPHILLEIVSPKSPANPSDTKIATLYKALVLATHDYVYKNGFPGALLGLSGGIDSALVLAIAVDALGANNVKVISMPSRFTAEMSIEDAVAQAETMGVECSILSIEPMFEAALDTLDDEFAGLPKNVAEENLQARIRGMLLMAISNKTGRIVLTTGNKSEMAVGYATLYGDMAGGFAVLKDVLKTQVYALAHYRNSVSKVIPDRVLTRAPSAELAHDQRDQDSLPPYEILDQILTRYIEFDESVAQMLAAGFDDQTVNKVVTMVDKNEYKRRQSPPGPRVTSRAFGRDRRYPITSGFKP